MATSSSFTSEDGRAQLNSTKDSSNGSFEKARVEKEGKGEIQESKTQQQFDWRAAVWEWTCYEELYNKQGQKIWPKKQKLHLKATYPIKGKVLYLKLGQLKECLDPKFEEGDFVGPETDETIGQMQLRHLIRFVETEYSETTAMHQRMKESGRVSFDMLWTFVTPGENLVYRCSISDEELCGKIRKAVYKLNNCNQWCLELGLDVFNYDCEGYKKHSRNTEVLIYEDEKPWRELEAYPYRFLEDSAEIEARFLARGARFGYLACSVKYRYMQFSGSMFTMNRSYAPIQILKENAHGRVMVDQFAFSKMDKDRVMGRAEPPSKVTREARVRTVDIAQDPNRIYAPAIVYGFSFRLKKWGCFSVEGFAEVIFDGGSSWNQLVMDPNLKEVTEHLVGQHLRKAEDGEQRRIDPIPNKGEGCIIIRYGPPGIGKTLTAESLAEKLHAPLWSLSVSELGTASSELETRLVNLLEIAVSWKTILLLDEADVYSHLNRYAMYGIFLKNLEYYQGVLLLTTNRIPTFDDAFRSRISVFLHYPQLMAEQREKVWANLLNRAEIQDDGGAVQQLVKDMAVFELNGREIRNAIRYAQTLAQSIKEPLGCKHILNATKVLACALKALKEVKFTPFGHGEFNQFKPQSSWITSTKN
ncbi:hypothetical protein R1sor_008297 [Riccia sorocarpa]|uniref:AAA+ ATPase domain-containing protein n=1 Tax=Riccia sorocarpa TaxID=122646 RepID=A0ABD3HX52_9MARC